MGREGGSVGIVWREGPGVPLLFEREYDLGPERWPGDGWRVWGRKVGRCQVRKSRGNVPVWGMYGRVRWPKSSRGRRVLILVLVRECPGRGPVRGFLHLAGLSEVGSLKGYGAGKLAGSWAAAVHMGEGV